MYRETAVTALQCLCSGSTTDSKKHPYVAKDIQAALDLLTENAFHPKLQTHQLKGKLEGSWACSAGYDLRIVFKFVQSEGSEAILLETVGTHEEVY